MYLEKAHLAQLNIDIFFVQRVLKREKNPEKMKNVRFHALKFILSKSRHF